MIKKVQGGTHVTKTDLSYKEKFLYPSFNCRQEGSSRRIRKVDLLDNLSIWLNSNISANTLRQ